MITADSILIELEKLAYKEVCAKWDEKTALACTKTIVNCLYLNFKGRLMYIPSAKKKQETEELQKLYASIYKEFTGNNQKELAIKYGRSEQNIYSITKKQKNKHILEMQTDLFPREQAPDKRPTTLVIIEDYLPNELTHCGLSKQEASELSTKIATHLCANFAGVSISLSEAIVNKRNNDAQTSIF